MSKQLMKSSRKRKIKWALVTINVKPNPMVTEELRSYFAVLKRRGDIVDYSLEPAVPKTHYVVTLFYPMGKRGVLKNVRKLLQYLADKYKHATTLTLFYGVHPTEETFYPREW